MSLKQEAFNQGLNEEEYNKILSILDREPNSVELSIFAVMWSEHCSYKSSRVHLKKLPTKSERVVQGPGENAGVIDIDDGDYLAFKIESHNHPSYIEPFQGAATGVGGILRDIFAMGARPVAVLDSLHFGELSHPKTPMLMKGVVGGISHYGNCMGIPNLGGETRFAKCYNGNILVNAMAMGLVSKETIQKGIAQGAGRVVIYLGAPTGCDGVHGATMASEEFNEDSEAKLPTVQVGDPFYQKILMEACMEMVEQKLLFGIQDMGAAGITCSTFEMSAKGNSGMDIDLDKIPCRQNNMTPFELFLSESQERMLLVVDPDKVEKVLAIAKKWNIDCAKVGVVKDQPHVTAYFKGEKVVDLPVMPITEEAPLYQRPYIQPDLGKGTLSKDQVFKQLGENVQNALKQVLESNSAGLKNNIFDQYDSTVRSDTVMGPGHEAGVLRIKGKEKKIAVTVDSKAALCHSNPKLGIMHTVAESVLNLACVGAKAIGITNCLNFGNPEEEKIMGQFVQTIDGLSEAADFFATPVTGGNVSFYNQTKEVNIYPTPTIGMIGLVEHNNTPASNYFTHEGDIIYLLDHNDQSDVFYNSMLTEDVLQESNLECPSINLEAVKKLQNALIDLNHQDLLHTAKDLSDGGLWLALVEASIHKYKPIAANIKLENNTDAGLLHTLLHEKSGRAIIAFKPEHQKNVDQCLTKHGIEFSNLGKTGGNILYINKDVYAQDVANIKQQMSRHWL
ncbi:MAG TPA: phosphoribosylformylglycinamidine synthase subunit PurL [Oligoflexia bacterium]|nr:phosphoribosylformylglycinamidine synthase subunit PurL [Oligoflexia bacterium]HMR23773.1 phosphoribosylformylglycinamidine synthase subunit PurL [Oligoflexia bacterium]